MPFILKTKISESASLGIWQITETEQTLHRMTQLAPGDEERLTEISHPLRRCQWLACRAVVSGLSGKQEVFLEYSYKGAPLYADGSLQVSFSHTGNFSAAIIAEGHSVGLDIELLRDRIIRVADRFMTEEEKARTGEPDLLDKLYIHWTAKEALYKLHGGNQPDIHHGIVLEPFDYLCSGSGVVPAYVVAGETRINHLVSWVKTKEFMLAYALEPFGKT